MGKKLSLIILLLIFSANVNAKEIKLGTYKISSTVNGAFLLVEKNGNIELGNEQSPGEKLWDVYSGGNYYYIKSHNNNGRAIEIAGAGRTNGTNIKTWTVNNTNAQKWKLNYAGNNSYYITSVMGNYNVDLNCGVARLGMNIQMYQGNGTNAQKWRFQRIDEEEQPLIDGNYIIKARNNAANTINLTGYKTANGTNVQVFTNMGHWAQVWVLSYSNGFYKLISYLNQSKAIDVNGGTLKNGSNIQLYASNSSNAQKFKIIKNDDGTYSIRSFDGLWTFDVGSNTNPGANVQLYQPNDSNAQKFYFEKVNISDVETGYYNIESVQNENMVIGVSNKALANYKNVEIREKTDYNYTKWYIKKIERDVYNIYNADSRVLVLDVSGNSKSNGTNIQLYAANKSVAQKWIIRKNDDGTYKFVGIASNRVLDIKGSNAVVGANIQLYSENGTDAQKFRITSTQVSEHLKEYEAGDYVIKNSNGKALDISSASKANGANVQLYTSNNTKAQVWRLKYNGDGEYVISSLINPKLVLTASSNNVVSSKVTNSDYQKWFFDKDGSTTLIMNKATGKYLDISGNNVVLNTNSTANSKFSLTSFNKTLVYRGIDVSAHNGNINWSSVSTSAVDFAIIRAGYAEEKIVNGVDKYEDTKFIKNVEECEKYNIPYALYFYSYANYITGNYDSAELEATHMLKLMKKIKDRGYYPTMSTVIYFDQEDSTLPSDRNVLTNMINKFCGTMKNNGNRCGVYANQNWLNNRIYVNYVADKHSIWVAQWPGYSSFDTAMNSRSSYTTTSHKLWQFSSDGSIPGISGRVDVDLGYDIFK